MLENPDAPPLLENDNTALVASLMAELRPRVRILTTRQKALLAAHFTFSLTLGVLSVFLNKQQTQALCKENFHFNSASTLLFLLINGSSNSWVSVYTGAEIFSAMQRALVGKNKPFYQQHNNSTRKILGLSFFGGLLAATPIMLTIQDPVGSKLSFVAYFVMATYSLNGVALDFSIAAKQNLSGVQHFSAALKAYRQQLCGFLAHNKSAPRWIKISSAVFLPLFFNGPFCISNILLLNDPKNDIGALQYLLPNDEGNRLITASILGTVLTVPWFILAGLFGYHLPDTLLEQFYERPFARSNYKADLSLCLFQAGISLCTWATPLKFFLDTYEAKEACDDWCIFTAILVAISGVLFSVIPNQKIVEMMVIIFNLFFSFDEDNFSYTNQVVGTRELEVRFRDLEINFSAEKVNSLGADLADAVNANSSTEHTSLLAYRSSALTPSHPPPGQKHDVSLDTFKI